MRSENDNALFGFVFIVCPILYFLIWNLPYLIFYVLPFLGSTFLVGNLWIAGCHAKPVDYRRVALLMAATVVFLIVTIGFPHPIALTGKREAIIESPFLFTVFNSLSLDIEGLINASWLRHFRWIFPGLLPPATYAAKLYDLRNLAWALWVGVCFGAPAVFFRSEAQQDQERIRKIEADCLAKVEAAHVQNFELRRDLWQEQSRTKSAITERDGEIKKLQEVVTAMQNPIGPPLPPISNNSENGAPPPGEASSVFDANTF